MSPYHSHYARKDVIIYKTPLPRNIHGRHEGRYLHTHDHFYGLQFRTIAHTVTTIHAELDATTGFRDNSQIIASTSNRVGLTDYALSWLREIYRRGTCQLLPMNPFMAGESFHLSSHYNPTAYSMHEYNSITAGKSQKAINYEANYTPLPTFAACEITSVSQSSEFSSPLGTLSSQIMCRLKRGR